MATKGVINWSTTAANNNSADSAVNWSEGQAPSSVNDSARGEMASVAMYRDDISGSLTTGGTSTAYTLTTNQDIGSLTVLNGKELACTMHTTSGATPTLAVDGLTAKNIRHATGATLPTGALLSGSVYRFKYDNSAGEFLLMNQLAVLPASLVTTAALADAAVTLAKQANLAQNTVIGRYTASTGVPQALTLSTGLSVDTSTGNVTTTVNPTFLPNFISGLTLSTAGSSTTMSIAAGAANDSTNTTIMKLSSAISKTTASWAVGTGNGGIDTGSIANSTWYHFYEITKSDGSAADVTFSLNATTPALTAPYTLYRRIGSGLTNSSGQWVKFTQTAGRFIWDTPTTTTPSIGTSASSITLGQIPTGVVVEALLRVYTGAGGSSTVIFTSLQESDQSPTGNNGDLLQSSSGETVTANIQRLTNTSAQIRARASNAGITCSVTAYGYIDFRGQ